MPEKTKSPYLRALSDYWKILPWLWPIMLAVTAMGAAALALGFLSYSLLIITLPFIFIPFFFGMHLTVLYLRNNRGFLSASGFFQRVGAYFQPLYYGSYRVTWSIIKSWLFSILLGTIGLSIAYGVLINDPSFADALSRLGQAVSAGDLNLAISILSEGSALSYFYFGEAIAQAGIFIVLAAFFIIQESSNVEFRRRLAKGFNPMAALMLKRLYKMEDRSFSSSLYKGLWPVYLLLAGGFVLGASLTWVICYPGQIYYITGYAVCGGVAGLILFAVILGPYIFLLEYHLCEDRDLGIKESAFKMAESAIRAAEQSQAATQANLDKMRQDIEDEKAKRDGVIDGEAKIKDDESDQ